MRCFLACFGSSKYKKERHRQSNQIPSAATSDLKRRGCNPVQQVVHSDEKFTQVRQVVLSDEDVKPVQQAGSPNEGKLDSPTSLISTFQYKSVDEFSAGILASVQHEATSKEIYLASPNSVGSRSGEKSAYELSFGGKKKVSFNSEVKRRTHEPDATCELSDKALGRDELGEKAESLAKPSKPNSLSEAGSNSSSLGSCYPNHRYQKWRESDEELELDYEESDMDVDISDSDTEEYYYRDRDTLTDSVCSMHSTATISLGDEISPQLNSIRRKTEALNRCNDAYDQTMLKPVENLSQWKALKLRGKPPLQHQTENSSLDLQELPAISYSSEPHFNQSTRFKSKVAQGEQRTQAVAIDASLSNWLTSPQQPINKSSHGTIAFQDVIPQQSALQGSCSPRNLEDRPILGALTVEELQLMSRTSSPRRSPTKSPDDMAIIGSVGSYWSRDESDKDSASVSSFKGIPNTTSKYREDKTVSWHSTPFETRLEKALRRGSTQA